MPISPSQITGLLPLPRCPSSWPAAFPSYASTGMALLPSPNNHQYGRPLPSRHKRPSSSSNKPLVTVEKSLAALPLPLPFTTSHLRHPSQASPPTASLHPPSSTATSTRWQPQSPIRRPSLKPLSLLCQTHQALRQQAPRDQAAPPRHQALWSTSSARHCHGLRCPQ